MDCKAELDIHLPAKTPIGRGIKNVVIRVWIDAANRNDDETFLNGQKSMRSAHIKASNWGVTISLVLYTSRTNLTLNHRAQVRYSFSFKERFDKMSEL